MEKLKGVGEGGGFNGLATTAASPQFTTEIYNSVQKHVVRNWDGPDAKAFAGIYKSNKVCSVRHSSSPDTPTVPSYPASYSW